MAEQFAGGVDLMFIGMSIVFVFLAMLVVVVNLMSRVIARLFPEVPAAAPAGISSAPPVAAVEEELIAAISAAIHRHRGEHIV